MLPRFSAFAHAAVVAACGAPPAVAPTAPATVPTSAPALTTTSPCFGGPPLVASTVHLDLQHVSHDLNLWDGETPHPRERYGACIVEDGQLRRESDGVTIAHLGCGILVEQRGVVDNVGLQVGARGTDLIARNPRNRDRLRCYGRDGKAYCTFRPANATDAPVTYTIDGDLPADVIEGDTAIAWLSERTVAAFHVTMYCH